MKKIKKRRRKHMIQERKNEYERATDELLQGAQQEKKKRKKQKKQQQVIKPQFSFPSASGRPERDSYRDDRGGRGRGGDRERGGGFGRGSGRGFGDSRGGFGSRGRGRRNDDSAEFDNRSGAPQPHRPQPQYRLKNDGNNAAASGQQHDQSLHPQAPTNT
ncbi:hypothetical protein RFI_29034 [Reticulomyxa filosa]|uniref:Uncharacterized protein n=1 Tax=Reticulomyxa filosa TaxID=46433 RepID=X6M2F9_RETFI|nr:hypothetical protein RFI_29034 [Reticulomyxa filosa]|eukprot:ETO08353.1 hypothetical protein RFI_29034 [Reticulomyxa filosa]